MSRKDKHPRRKRDLIAKLPNDPIEKSYQRGEPQIVPLRKFRNDRSMRGDFYIICCDCGLEHLFTSEIFQSPVKDMWMTVRGYADDRTGLRGKKRKLKRKK